MKHKLIIIFLLFVLPNAFGQTKSLFRIIENEKVGYIDQTGKVILQPQYKNGLDFSENVAAVRLNGKYGFIDATGRFVIQPKYDFATAFYNGIACVYINGKQSFIDKNEKTVFGKPFIGVAFISRNLAWMQTASRKKGIINIKTKKFVADTIYNSIGEFDHGVTVVTTKNDSDDNRRNNYAIIDTIGNYIVPFGKYEEINRFVDGYARVQIKDETDEESSIDGVIDTKGNLLFQRPYRYGSYISEDFHDGYAVVYLRKQKNGENSFDDSYQGYINLKGEIVLNDTLNQYLENFSGGRTFIKNQDEKYMLMDTNFNRLGTKTFDRVLNDGFINGYAIVQVEDKWGIIDANGDFAVEPLFNEIHNAGLIGNYFFYSNDQFEDEKRYGIAQIGGKIIMQPVLQDFDPNGFRDGLLKVMVDNKLTYIDTSGTIIWQEKKGPQSELALLDIDYMNRGYFYAYSKPNGNDLGGFGSSKNTPKKIGTKNFPKGKLVLKVDTSAIDSSNEMYNSYLVNISNLSKSDINFNAQDSRLDMIVQAKDTDGQWKAIEYLPSSWCGNSYHTLTLEKNNYWTFLTPIYDGEYKTKLRIELKYIDPADKSQKRFERKELTLYSNEYDGGVNPAQFWNKRVYYPGGIMDPYED